VQQIGDQPRLYYDAQSTNHQYLVFSMTVGLDRKEVLSLNVQDHYISIEIKMELYKCT